VRRLQRKFQAHVDGALVRGLRGRPSNHQLDAALQQAALQAYACATPTLVPPSLARSWPRRGWWSAPRRSKPTRTERKRRLLPLTGGKTKWACC
jgi:hypothetical protein